MLSNGSRPDIDDFAHRASILNNVFAAVNLVFIPLIVFGNFLVLSSVCVFKRLRTLTNCLLLSLSVSDLIVGIVTCPLYVAFYLDAESLLYNRLACLTWFASVILGCGSSLYNLLFIVVDRFIAIHFPFRYPLLQTPRNLGITLAVLWLYCVTLSALPLLGWNNWTEREKCSFYTTLPRAYVSWAAYGTVGACTLLSSVLYGKIFLEVRRHRKRIHAQHSSVVTSEWLEEVKSARLTASVFLLFVLFWTPYFCVGPLKYAHLDLPQEVVEMIKNGALLVAFANSIVNPVVYGLARKQFRMAYRLLLTTPITRWYALSGYNLECE